MLGKWRVMSAFRIRFQTPFKRFYTNSTQNLNQNNNSRTYEAILLSMYGSLVNMNLTIQDILKISEMHVRDLISLNLQEVSEQPKQTENSDYYQISPVLNTPKPPTLILPRGDSII